MGALRALTDVEVLYQQYLTDLLAGDRKACQQGVQLWLELNPSLRSLYEGLFQRGLYEVGSLWEQGRISVAREHLATALTEALMTDTYPQLIQPGATQGLALVACAVDESHQVGPKMVSDFLEMSGWRCRFLGAGTTPGKLLDTICDQEVDLVALSVAMVFHLEALYSMVKIVREVYPNKPILVGGQGFRVGGKERFEQMPGVHCLCSLGELEAWLERR